MLYYYRTCTTLQSNCVVLFYEWCTIIYSAHIYFRRRRNLEDYINKNHSVYHTTDIAKAILDPVRIKVFIHFCA